MWATAETWIEKIQNLLKPTPLSDEYPNDRLPSEQVVPTFWLRGYRGPETLVATQKYFKAKPLERFIWEHNKDMARRGWPVSAVYVEQDLVTLQEIAEASDAVIVRPAY